MSGCRLLSISNFLSAPHYKRDWSQTINNCSFIRGVKLFFLFHFLEKTILQNISRGLFCSCLYKCDIYRNRWQQFQSNVYWTWPVWTLFLCILREGRVLKIFWIYSKTKTFLSFVVPQSISGPGSVVRIFRTISFGVVSCVVLNHF